MVHISINCPLKVEQLKKRNTRFQVHADEYDNQEDEEINKEDEDSCEEYALISALTSSVSPGNDTWIVYSGSSKHMIGYKESFSCFIQRNPHTN